MVLLAKVEARADRFAHEDRLRGVEASSFILLYQADTTAQQISLPFEFVLLDI